MVKKLVLKYKAVAAYVFFGALTTLINIISYTACYEKLGISNVLSNITAWILSVMFAFITNKLWVFESKSMKPDIVTLEFINFTAARLATGALDLAIMYAGVDLMHLPALWMKVLANVIVVVLNYVLSKFLIFKKR